MHASRVRARGVASGSEVDWKDTLTLAVVAWAAVFAADRKAAAWVGSST